MNSIAHAPRLACIVFARIQDYASKPVREQAQLGNDLHALIEAVLADLPSDERLVLDVPGGAAIVVPDDPPAALLIAERLHARAPALALCIGLNYGPVKLAEAGGATELIGDGLQSAATTAEFATPQRWLAARSFRDALLEAAPDEAGRLVPAGVFTDTQVRAHELYAIDAQAARGRRARLLVFGALAVVAILGAGVGTRLLLKDESAAPQAAAALPAPAPAASAAPIPVARPAAPAVAGAEPLAIISLDIKPSGEVLVDGVLKGKVPPLTEIELKAGKHMILVRNGNHKPLETEVNLTPGEKIVLSHRFFTPQAKRKDATPTPGSVYRDVKQDVRRRLGI